MRANRVTRASYICGIADSIIDSSHSHERSPLKVHNAVLLAFPLGKAPFRTFTVAETQTMLKMARAAARLRSIGRNGSCFC